MLRPYVLRTTDTVTKTYAASYNDMKPYLAESASNGIRKENKSNVLVCDLSIHERVKKF